jgi:hypothetical protein
MKPADARYGAALAALLCAAPAAFADDDAGWPVAGRQGLIQVVIVPLAQARDRAAYARQIERLCAGQETCFVNFYTNSSGAPVALPLPDAIAHEATAVLRRSAKQGTEGFRFACRLATGDESCF